MQETQPSAIGPVDDIDQNTWKYINQNWGLWYWIPAVLFLIGTMAAIYYIEGEDVINLIVLPLMWVLGGYGYARGKIVEAFIRQFAAANNLHYIGKSNVLDMTAALFDSGHSKAISHTIGGIYQNHSIEIFYYQYTTGQGKQKAIHPYTVVRIALQGTAPDILMESKKNLFQAKRKRSNQKELLLESNFRDHFTTYVPEDFGIETFEIFTPEILTRLIDTAQSFDFEFIESALYVYTSGTIEKRARLTVMLELAQYLITTIGPRITRLSDDVKAMKEAYAKN